ncbi:hypothetical protein HTS61_08485 [Escherichia coli]|nr:hypothetical protein [Escherichia coli]
MAPKQEFLATLPDGPVKNNVLNQLAAIEEKRIKTPAENIRFKLNSRWFDRSVILEFLQEKRLSGSSLCAVSAAGRRRNGF